MSYEERWYVCDLIDSSDIPSPPDFSKIPEDRRGEVLERWEKSNIPQGETWKLWGPQIEGYRKMGFEVVVR